MSELVPGICHDNDTVLVKHQYDAFHGTRLEELLRSNNIRHPVICGVMTNLCCETTLRSAFVKGFRPVLPLDATAAYNRLLHISAFRNIAFGFSPAMTASEVLGNISGL
jgi:isochorismate hydrolase